MVLIDSDIDNDKRNKIGSAELMKKANRLIGATAHASCEG